MRSSLQPGSFIYINREYQLPGNFISQLKIYQVIFFGEIPMGNSISWQYGFLPPSLTLSCGDLPGGTSGAGRLGSVNSNWCIWVSVRSNACCIGPMPDFTDASQPSFFPQPRHCLLWPSKVLFLWKLCSVRPALLPVSSCNFLFLSSIEMIVSIVAR